MKLATVIGRGLSSARPAVGDVPIGSLYSSTDLAIVERNSGVVWEAFDADATVSTLLGELIDGDATHVLQDQVLSEYPALGIDTITFVIDGGGTEIADGVHGDLEIPWDCTIMQATLLADQSGSIVIDIWKDVYANFPPDNSDSITASAPPTISTATNSQDVTLTGWTKTVTAGDILRFNVDSCTTIERVTLALKVQKL